MKRFLIIGAFALRAGGQALAADRPPPVAPRAPAVYVPTPVPYYNRTGFYIGGNIGGGWQQGGFTDSLGLDSFAAQNTTKGLGGGQVGVNYEFANGVVGGADAMFDWRFNNQNTLNSVNGLAQITSNNNWLTTATAKLGYAWDRTLVYAEGGGAWVGTSNSVFTDSCCSYNVSGSNYGWTVGVGVEYAIWGTWSARVEYDYVGLTNQTLTVPQDGSSLAGDQFTGGGRNVQMVTLGINYKFGGW